ncbi:MAG: hypothetical protein C0518_13410 [Opitutus sp.]|nr:hypothetical protein [Opitutus sp.]
MLLRLSTQTLVISLLLLGAGCRDREVTAYRIPKEPAPAASAPKLAAPTSQQLPDGHPPIGGGDAAAAPARAPDGSAMGALPEGSVSKNNALTWTAPAHWQQKAPGSVRKGSYAITGEGNATGDLSITAFPGDTGGLHANVNRWRGQIGLGPVGNAEVEAGIEHIDMNGLHADFVDLTGPNGIRLLGAIVPHERETWFFKLTGPDALLAKERAAFREFINTIKVR